MIIEEQGIRIDGLPATYQPLVTKKSDLLIRAKVALVYEQFGAAAELFLEAAEIEAQLANMAEEAERYQAALVHFVSEMSCLANAGDVARAIKRSKQILSLSYLTERLRKFVLNYTEQLEQRQHEWIRSVFENPLAVPV